MGGRHLRGEKSFHEDGICRACIRVVKGENECFFFFFFKLVCGKVLQKLLYDLGDITKVAQYPLGRCSKRGRYQSVAHVQCMGCSHKGSKARYIDDFIIIIFINVIIVATIMKNYYYSYQHLSAIHHMNCCEYGNCFSDIISCYPEKQRSKGA